MTDKLFNTAFETSLRLLLLLNMSKRPLTLDRILAYDFISTHGDKFKISEESINGNNGFAFSEYALKRVLIDLALKDLVLNTIVTALEKPAGFQYQITPKGTSFANKLRNDYYAIYYKDCCNLTMNYFGEYSDDELADEINRASIQALREEV